MDSVNGVSNVEPYWELNCWICLNTDSNLVSGSIREYQPCRQPIDFGCGFGDDQTLNLYLVVDSSSDGGTLLPRTDGSKPSHVDWEGDPSQRFMFASRATDGHRVLCAGNSCVVSRATDDQRVDMLQVQ